MEIKLRPFTETDLEQLVKHANNPNISKTLMDAFPYPYTLTDGKKFIQLATDYENKLTPYRLVIQVEGKFAGCIGLHPEPDIFRLNSEIAYWVSETFWGKGIGTQAIKQMTEIAFSQFDFTRIFARVFGSNIASQKALENAGYVLEYTIPSSIIKFDKLEDCLVYGVSKK